MTRSSVDGKRTSLVVWIARILLLLWVGFWVWFNVASGIGEFPELGWGALTMHLLVANVIAGAGFVAWLWPRVGGLVLLVLGAFMAWFFNPDLLAGAILVLPPIVTGALLLLTHRRPRTPSAPASAE